MAKLSGQQRAFIVIYLANFYSVSEVQEVFKEEYDKEISTKQIEYYNPGINTELSEKWKNLFYQTREKFKDEVNDISISKEAMRKGKLSELFIDLAEMKEEKKQDK